MRVLRRTLTGTDDKFFIPFFSLAVHRNSTTPGHVHFTYQRRWSLKDRKFISFPPSWLPLKLPSINWYNRLNKGWETFAYKTPFLIWSLPGDKIFTSKRNPTPPFVRVQSCHCRCWIWSSLNGGGGGGEMKFSQSNKHHFQPNNKSPQ